MQRRQPLLLGAYIYTFFLPFGRVMPVEVVMRFGREYLDGLWCWQSHRRGGCGEGLLRRL